MADSILRLKVESQEYDNKLKQATNGLTRYVDECRKVGGTLEVVEKETLDYVRAIGQMDTTSRTATGKLAEMKKTFVELSAQYKQMSDAEKNAPFGKALAASLDQLKPRINEVKQQLDDIHMSLGGGGLFSGLGDKMSGALQVFGGNLMTKGAAMVANFASEMGDAVKQGIELARQGEGIRIAFERLGRGDILDGLRKATHGTVTDLELMKAAVKFNDFNLPLEELGILLQFAQQKAKDTGQSVDYLVESIVNGLGRKSLMILDNLGLSATEVKERMAETGDMTKAVGEIIREQMSKAGDYVETAADRAAQAHVSLQNKMEELGRKFSPLQEASNNFWTSMKIGILDIVGGPLTNLLNKLTEAGRLMNAYGQMGGNAKVGRLTSNLASAREGNRQSIYQQQQEQFWRYINPREQQIRDIRAWQSGQRGEALQGRISAITEKYGSLDSTKIQAEVDAAKKMLSDYQAAAKQILQPIEQKIVPTVVDGRSGGKGGGSDDKKEFDINSIALDKNKAMLSAEKGTDSGPSEIWKSITQGAQESTSEVERLTKAFEDLNRAEGDANVQGIAKDGKVVKGSFSDAASSVGSLGAALAGLDDPAAKIAGVIAQSIANVALAFSNAQLKDGETGNVWYWISAIAAGTAAMISTIATIHSATGFQNGGMIKGYSTGGTIQGNSYSGDNIGGMVDGSQLIGLNAGEVVLNKAQQATLAQNLQSNGGGMRVVGEIRGESIVLVANRYFKRTGQGEIVTW